VPDRRSPCGPILVVEDDAFLADLLADALGHAGWTPVVARSSREAVAAAHESQLAAAVLDVTLPDGTGYELCRSLREQYGDALPIVLVSGVRVESYDRVAGLLLGADDYLPKPFEPDELVVRLRRLLERSHAVSARDLTGREHEVLTLLAEGMTQGEIAERLVIASKTVATHIERILGKLGVHSRAQAVACAYREQLIAP
jgi:DNA-binding NarL/FixJ family response regulator